MNRILGKVRSLMSICIQWKWKFYAFLLMCAFAGIGKLGMQGSLFRYSLPFNEPRYSADLWHTPSSLYIRDEKLNQTSAAKKFAAVIVALVRLRELEGLLETLDIFEKQFNWRFGYPYVFLNDEYFTEEFKYRVRQKIASYSKAKVQFGRVPVNQWSYPDWIDQQRAREARIRMRHVLYGSDESYRFMCRYQSGFFFRHPLLMDYDYYWRIEPYTRLLCQVPYDPFEYMHSQGIKYGFNVHIQEIQETIPSLWDTVIRYVEWKHDLNPRFNPVMLRHFLDPQQKHYNLCHFWSNFEIASLHWLRSAEYLEFFDYLDRSGGFFYERWGDAPVHSLAVGLFLNRSEVHYFGDIGYFHSPLTQCPLMPVHAERQCDCDMATSIDWTGSTCMPMYHRYQPSPWF